MWPISELGEGKVVNCVFVELKMKVSCVVSLGVAFGSTFCLCQHMVDSAAPEWHVQRPVPSRVALVLERSLNWKGFDS